MKRLLLVVTLFIGVTSLFGAEPLPPFDFRADLAVLHGEIPADVNFQAWDRTDPPAHRLARWAEMRRSPVGTQTILLQEGGSLTESGLPLGEMFLALVQYGPGASRTVIKHRILPKNEVAQSYNEAEQKYLARGFTKGDIAFVIPVVDLESEKPLSWRFQTMSRDAKILTVTGGGAVIEGTLPVLTDETHDCTPGVDDALSENDLHHPNNNFFAAEAVNFAGDPRKIHESAINLCHKVSKLILYQMVGGADVYTDSDSLVRSRQYGVCDEMSVLLVTYLRAIGIPARVKFLIWDRDGKKQGHACVEYYHEQERIWYHLDPTWDVIHDPTVYRNTIVDGGFPKNVSVVDVDWPADARSSSPVDLFNKDPDGDGRLNPSMDFCYSPSKKGDPQRPGYSQ